jgi:hypothetical protein
MCDGGVSGSHGFGILFIIVVGTWEDCDKETRRGCCSRGRRVSFPLTTNSPPPPKQLLPLALISSHLIMGDKGSSKKRPAPAAEHVQSAPRRRRLPTPEPSSDRRELNNGEGDEEDSDEGDDEDEV